MCGPIMWYLLAEIILGARRHEDDKGGWMQILVFIVVGVFYALGSILKRKANKITESDFPDEQQQEPSVSEGFEEEAVQPVGDERHRAYGREIKIPPKLVKHIRPIFGKIDTRTFGEPEEVKKPVGRALKPIKKLNVGLSEKKEVEKKTGPLLDIEQTDELRRAIVYSEILGKPVSLRKPKEQAAGF